MAASKKQTKTARRSVAKKTTITRQDLIDEHTCQTAAEFMADVVAMVSPSSPHFIFRGQVDAAWWLEPKVCRTAWSEYLEPAHAGASTAEERLWRELKLVIKFLDRVDSMGQAIPDDNPALRIAGGALMSEIAPAISRTALGRAFAFPPEAMLSQFALAQHYGMPTRLLDWSASPWIAGFFAAEQLFSDHPPTLAGDRLALWAIDRRWWDDRRSVTSEEWRTTVVTAPYASNLFLRVQQGLFVAERGADVGDLCTALAEEYNALPPQSQHKFARGSIKKLTLPHGCAADLLRGLERFGVHMSSIYPWFETAARDVRMHRRMP